MSMRLKSLPRKRPVPCLASAAFVVSLTLTLAYFAGLVPGVSKTLPTFVDLLQATTWLLALAVLTWTISFVADWPGSDASG